MLLTIPLQPTINEVRWFAESCRAPIARPISRWVEEEVVLPTGPHANERFRLDFHPASRIWFKCLEDNRWSRYAATAGSQQGKSLQCYTLPILYHLFELKETVVIGLPDMNMANDKWANDFLPIILASRYADLLPNKKGEGSRGGAVKHAIKFRHGPTMRFMTGGGGDKSVASFTSRVVGVTETDGMDEPGETSRESNRIKQIEARSRAFCDDTRTYLECTTSIERGCIWQEIKNGTDSRLIRPCPHCNAWVSPEREHLIGWREAKSFGEARESATWSCPACAHPWTEAERQGGWKQIRIVHRGQEIAPDGTIIGDPVKTDTLGFRWSAIDNPFTTAAKVGGEEWKAAHSKDKENAEKEMRQFVWAIPYEPPEIEMTPLDAEEIQQRQSGLKRGIVPDDCIGIGVGTDTGKRKLHWTAMALRANGTKAIIEYGEQQTNADAIGLHNGLVTALRALRKYWEKGWQTAAGKTWIPSQVWIDSGYYEHTDSVYEFCQEANAGIPMGQDRYRPAKGYGESQRMIGRYVAPFTTSVHIGNQYHIAGVKRNGSMLPGVLLVHVNADHWKSVFHQGLSLDATSQGAITLWDTAGAADHQEWAAQVTAEKQVEKNGAIVWERSQRNNHQLDAGYNATCACEFIREFYERAQKARPRTVSPQIANETTDRPFLASLR